MNKWFAVAIYGARTRPITGRERDRQLYGPFGSDEERDEAIEIFVEENGDEQQIAVVPIDVESSDDEAVLEIPV